MITMNTGKYRKEKHKEQRKDIKKASTGATAND